MDDLSTIRILRELDIPIKDIKKMLNQDNLDVISRLLDNKRQSIDNEIVKLIYYKQNIRHLLQAMEDFESDSPVELRMRPKLYSVIIESVIDDFDSSLLNTVDTIIKELQPYKLWLSFSQNISIISKENIMTGNYHNYLSNGIISYKKLELKTHNIANKVFEKEMCLFKTAIITDESYSSIDQHYEIMKEWANKHGYLINGNSMEINIYNQRNKNYIQIWIPVKEG